MKKAMSLTTGTCMTPSDNRADLIQLVSGIELNAVNKAIYDKYANIVPFGNDVLATLKLMQFGGKMELATAGVLYRIATYVNDVTHTSFNYKAIGFNSFTDFATTVFRMDKSQVSRYIKVYDFITDEDNNYLISYGVENCEYSISALYELSTFKHNKIVKWCISADYITPTTAIKTLREIAKLDKSCDSATLAQEKITQYIQDKQNEKDKQKTDTSKPTTNDNGNTDINSNDNGNSDNNDNGNTNNALTFNSYTELREYINKLQNEGIDSTKVKIIVE